MNVRDFECRSYEQSVELLEGKTRRTVCNNTELVVGANSNISVLLYGHPMASFWFAPDVLVLDSCGFRTVTTKDRINKCLPSGYYLSQVKGRWELWDPTSKSTVDFMDGMQIPL